MTNLEIARAFGEEDIFVRNILENLHEKGRSFSIGYCIFAEDHKPFTAEQQKIWDKYGVDDILELCVDIDIEELLG